MKISKKIKSLHIRANTSMFNARDYREDYTVAEGQTTFTTPFFLPRKKNIKVTQQGFFLPADLFERTSDYVVTIPGANENDSISIYI